MTTLLIIIFWVLVFIVFYTYIGYGLLLYVLLQIKKLFGGKQHSPRVATDEAELPSVTLMICAYNEESVVNEKMENIRQLSYPKDKLCVMWVTDGSDDHTNELLAAYPEVKLVYSPERQGKAHAMQHGLRENLNQIVIFTDANTMLNAEAISQVVTLFDDPSVGCVSGEKRVAARKEGQTAAEGEGLYWKYESRLKQWDSDLYSAMGAAGELFAVRMSVYTPAPANALLDDFMISMNILKRGYRIAYTSKAYAMEFGSANMHEESKRKRRIAAGGLQSTWWLRGMMNPFRHPLVAFQFISHRVLRWTLAPLALLLLIPVNILLVVRGAGTVYTVFAIAQLLFYLSALAGYVLHRMGKKSKLLNLPHYFLFMNLNVFSGVAYLMSHRNAGTWEKAKRG